MAGMEKRLDRLAVVWRAPEGCPTCRSWWGTVLGNDDGERSRPERCPECGRVVPIRSVVVVAGIDYRLI